MTYQKEILKVLLLSLPMALLGSGCCKIALPPMPILHPTPTPGPVVQPTQGPVNGQVCGEISARGVHFSAFDDFSFTSNPVPGGAWRYGTTAALGGSFNLYSFKGTLYSQPDPSIPLSMWLMAEGQVDPNVNKNETGSDIYSNAGEWVYLPAQTYLNFHPGPNGEISVVRWTCPAAGNYRIDSAFRSLRVGGPATTTDIHVLLNNAPVFNGVINAHYADGEFPYLANLEFHACDTLDFAVGRGENNEYSYDSSGIRATIDRE
jgi:hypothetical protein